MAPWPVCTKTPELVTVVSAQPGAPTGSMTHSLPPEDEQFLQLSIQQNLQDIALQMGHALDEQAAERLYQEASSLLSQIAHAPITLARLAGTLLVYQVEEAEAEELKWFKSQVQECSDDEAVEELIESIYRPDAL